MNKPVKRGLAATCLMTLVLNMTACGYFLYPERKGQSGGRVDPVVVILDGAGLLFGLLPGIVAFAVDFTNGTIYLPAGGSSAIDRHLTEVDPEAVKQVEDENGQVWLSVPLESVAGDAEDLAQVTVALQALTGRHVVATDIVWLEDLAALQRVRSVQGSTVSL